MGMSCVLGRRMGERRGEGGIQPSVLIRGWVSPLGQGCESVSNRLQVTDTFSCEIRAMRSAGATRRRLFRNGSHWVSGNRQRQERTDVRGNWNRVVSAMLTAPGLYGVMTRTDPRKKGAATMACVIR